jgi:hypothetical protein
VEKVRSSLVPVAMDRNEIKDAPGPAGDFFRAILRQWSQFQGIWIVSPEGKVLAWQYGSEDGAVEPWTGEVLRAIDRGLAAHGDVAPRAPATSTLLSSRGAGVEPDGSVVLALSSGFERGGRRDGPVVTEGIRLSAREWAAFVPPGAAPGIRWAIPAPVARKLCRALSPYSEPTITPEPRHVKAVEMIAAVESVRGGEARIGLTGRWETELEGGEPNIKVGKISASATAGGIALYDGNTRTMRSLLLVFRATYRHIDDPPETICAVVEWRADPGSPATAPDPHVGVNDDAAGASFRAAPGPPLPRAHRG